MGISTTYQPQLVSWSRISGCHQLLGFCQGICQWSAESGSKGSSSFPQRHGCRGIGQHLAGGNCPRPGGMGDLWPSLHINWDILGSERDGISCPEILLEIWNIFLFCSFWLCFLLKTTGPWSKFQHLTDTGEVLRALRRAVGGGPTASSSNSPRTWDAQTLIIDSKVLLCMVIWQRSWMLSLRRLTFLCLLHFGVGHARSWGMGLTQMQWKMYKLLK